jgi:hypothetical protein
MTPVAVLPLLLVFASMIEVILIVPNDENAIAITSISNSIF